MKHSDNEKRLNQRHSGLEQVRKSSDFHEFSPFEEDEGLIRVAYYSSLVSDDKVTRYLLPALREHRDRLGQPEELMDLLPFAEVMIANTEKEVVAKLMEGYVLLRMDSAEDLYVLANLNNAQTGQRQSNDTENEFSVMGPKVGFVENLDTNLHLLRQKLATPALIFETLTIGSHSNTRVVIAYLEDVTNPEIVDTMRQRLKSIDYEVLYDTSQLEEIIADQSNTMFPLYISTERVDRVTFALTSGQVAAFTDGSPYVMAAPANFLGFFVSPEDYCLPWILGSFHRIIRLLSVVFSVFATPIYVAIMTFHYEILPETMLGPLIQSRIHVPFLPVVEVIFLEITIDLLREAGARLPSKIGQTLGIVGPGFLYDSDCQNGEYDPAASFSVYLISGRLGRSWNYYRFLDVDGTFNAAQIAWGAVSRAAVSFSNRQFGRQRHSGFLSILEPSQLIPTPVNRLSLPPSITEGG